mgnify:CR=1 FL=1
MGASGGGGGGSTTQTTIPWAGIQPHILDVANQAKAEYLNTPNQGYYPGSTVVPFSQQTQGALDMTQERAMNGSPLIGASQDQLTATMRGDYLDPTTNPVWGSVSHDIRNQVNGQFGASGRTGSGAHQSAIAKGLGDAAVGLYEPERNRQMQGMFFAPQLAQQDYIDAQQLGSVGGAYEDLSGRYLQDNINRFEFGRDANQRALNDYSSVINGYAGIGGTTTGTQSQKRGSKLGGALGGAATGASVGSMFGPWGTAVGAGAGGLLGLFG